MPAYLVIDLGNSRSKLAVFRDRCLLEYFRQTTLSQDLIGQLKEKYEIEQAILLHSGPLDPELSTFLKQQFQFLEFDHQTPIPIKNLYTSPETLGPDRLAAAVAARSLAGPDKAILVIDTGTCLTFNLLNENNEYLGGAISPGIRIRFQAMHDYTAALPLIEDFYERVTLIGDSTEQSMKSGVINGIIAEVEGIIAAYRNKYPSLQVYCTGGGASFFEKHIENEIFAVPKLVLFGLHEILLYNDAL